jgi:glycosyltransferase involved in cell wall biosynthesis
VTLPVTVWMNMPSFYQTDLFAALAASGEVDVQAIFARPLAPERLQIGWESAPAERQDAAPLAGQSPASLTGQASGQGYRSRLLDRHASIRSALRLAWAQRDRLHVVNGIWAEPAFAAALCVLMATGACYSIYSEAPNPNRPRSRWKQAARTAFGRAVVRRSRGLLPVGRFGEDFFRTLGGRPEQIYPFGYFRAAPRGLSTRPRAARAATSCELIYVGQLVERKGLDLLLQAMAAVRYEGDELSLAIVGDGERRGSLQDQAAALGLTERVHFEGVIPSSQVLDRIAQADMLALPSRWDGWGLVVNESLMVGVPVLVSDRCGAADLVRDGRNGYVFRSGEVLDLENKLRTHLSHRKAWERFRAEAASTGAQISAERAGVYLIECMKHMLGKTGARPVPPWLQ